MFLRKYTRFVIFAITILLATLISEVLIKYLCPELNYKSILVRMGVVVVIYVPMMNFLERYIRNITKKYTQESKNMTKSSFLGLTIGFLLAFFILFVLFALVLMDKNFFIDLKNWISDLF